MTDILTQLRALRVQGFSPCRNLLHMKPYGESCVECSRARGRRTWDSRKDDVNEDRRARRQGW